MVEEGESSQTAPMEIESTPPPRLMITKMVLENFKSYAGVKEIGPFHKCFSSVVGPNGSGKSNVIDAMLFVFGKRAKKLRLNKVSELIHKSDAVSGNPPQFARVSVYFQEIVDTGSGDNDYDVVPNSEHHVTRIAKNDNSSTYKLDGKNCAFKDVAAYLDSKGIDLDNNRFLILQGEVEMISMMPPKGKTENDEGLLEYLEDIIGSNSYVEETNLAAQRVDLLSDQRQEKLNRVKAVENEKNSLEGAKLEAEALLTKERDIRRKKNILYQIHQMKASKEIEKVDEKKSVIAEKLEQERQSLKSSNNRVTELEGGLKKQRVEYNKIHKELTETKEEFSAFERRDIKLREEIKHTKAKIKKLRTKIETEDKKEAKAIKATAKAEASIPEIETLITELTDLKAEEDLKLEAILDESKGETDVLRRQLEEKSQELAPINQEKAVFQAALDTAITEVKLLTDAQSRAQEQFESAEKELANLDENQTKKRNELVKCEEELSTAKHRLHEAVKEEKELVEKESTLSKRSREFMAMVEEAKVANQAKGGRAPAVDGILKAARQGGELAGVGIVGRLGDLATIDEKYDVAVSTACSMLDYIVVQTTAGAQACLKFLRKHGLGRANFVPLDKMKKGAHDRTVETPEGAPRLFDLITPRKHFVSPALFLGVSNTLVAPDLETATRWAYDYSKRWRVVTIDGQLIEASGTMAGGGKSVRKGGMKLSNGRKAAIAMDIDTEGESPKVLEERAARCLSELQDCRKLRRDLVDEIRKLKKCIKFLEVRLPKLTMEIEGYDTTRKALTERLPELKAQCQLGEVDEEKLDELKSKVEQCKADMSSCAKQAAEMDAEVSRLQKAILDAGGKKLKKQRAKCDKVLQDLDNESKNLNSAKVAIRSNKKAAVKAKAAVELASKECEQSDEALEQKKEEAKSLENGALEVMQKYEEVKRTEGEKRELLEKATEECESLKKSLTKAKGKEIELMGQLDALNKQISDNERKSQHWQDEIDKLHADEEEYDEYDVSDDESEGPDTDTPDPKASENENGNNNEETDTKKETSTKMNETTEKEANERKTALATFTHDYLEQYSETEIKGDLSMLETERSNLAKNANMGAIAEYRKKEADYLSRVGELDSITEERNEARRTHEELRRLRLEKFMSGFGQITLKLKEMYQMITLGGDAELELVDSLDPFSEGIVFSVRPPKKSWKNIANLSGGEKTLSSLALVFALHHYKPTPLYVMDEIDAALDFKNVSIVANYIKERTKNAQFIIISLRNNMFELADRLVGIYKTNNCTKSVTIDPRAFGVAATQDGHRPFADRTNTRVAEKSGKETQEGAEIESSQDAMVTS